MSMSIIRGRAARTALVAAVVVAGLASAAPALANPGPNDSTSNGFNAVPTRILDTRYGVGGPVGKVSGLVQVTVPDYVDPTDSVLLSVTVVNPSGGGYITAYPDGQAAPATSDVNWVAGPTKAQSVLVTPPGSGVVDLNVVASAPIDLVVDAIGSFPAATYTALPSSTADRVLNTKAGVGATGAINSAVTVAVPSTVPSTATAIAVMIAQDDATGPGYMTALPAGGSFAGTSTINYTTGTIASNLAWVPLVNGQFTVYVKGAPTQAIADVKGYTTSTSALSSVASARIADSRTGTGGLSGPQSGTFTIALPTSGAVAEPNGTMFALLNVTLTGAVSSGGYLSTDQAKPGALQTSSLNFKAGQTVAGLVIAPVTNGQASLYLFGTVQVVADVEGYVGSASA